MSRSKDEFQAEHCGATEEEVIDCLQADCEAYGQRIDKLHDALRNILLTASRAARLTKGLAAESKWREIIRFCNEVGITSEPLRNETSPTDPTRAP